MGDRNKAAFFQRAIGSTSPEEQLNQDQFFLRLLASGFAVAADGSITATVPLTGLSFNGNQITAGFVDPARLHEIANAQIAAAAAIAYAKLNLAASIVNADVAVAAAIAYSKLNLAASIVNADIAAAAAIAASKLAPPGSDTQVLFNDNSAFAGDAGMTYAKATDILSLLGALKLGAANQAAAGLLRLSNNGAIAARNAANGADVQVAKVNATDELEIGDAVTLLSLLGGQVKFPVTPNPSTGGTVLDAYAENTWTPTDASGAALSFTTVEGHFVKIGQLVLASCTLTFPATGSGTQVLIGGLPFAVQNSTNNLWIGQAITTAAVTIYAQTVKNSLTFNLFSQAGAGAVSNTSLTGATVRVTLLYRATT